MAEPRVVTRSSTRARLRENLDKVKARAREVKQGRLVRRDESMARHAQTEEALRQAHELFDNLPANKPPRDLQEPETSGSPVAESTPNLSDDQMLAPTFVPPKRNRGSQGVQFGAIFSIGNHSSISRSRPGSTKSIVFDDQHDFSEPLSKDEALTVQPKPVTRSNTSHRLKAQLDRVKAKAQKVRHRAQVRRDESVARRAQTKDALIQAHALLTQDRDIDPQLQIDLQSVLERILKQSQAQDTDTPHLPDSPAEKEDKNSAQVSVPLDPTPPCEVVAQPERVLDNQLSFSTVSENTPALPRFGTANERQFSFATQSSFAEGTAAHPMLGARQSSMVTLSERPPLLGARQASMGPTIGQRPILGVRQSSFGPCPVLPRQGSAGPGMGPRQSSMGGMNPSGCRRPSHPTLSPLEDTEPVTPQPSRRRKLDPTRLESRSGTTATEKENMDNNVDTRSSCGSPQEDPSPSKRSSDSSQSNESSEQMQAVFASYLKAAAQHLREEKKRSRVSNADIVQASVYAAPIDEESRTRTTVRSYPDKRSGSFVKRRKREQKQLMKLEHLSECEAQLKRAELWENRVQQDIRAVNGRRGWFKIGFEP